IELRDLESPRPVLLEIAGLRLQGTAEPREEEVVGNQIVELADVTGELRPPESLLYCPNLRFDIRHASRLRVLVGDEVDLSKAPQSALAAEDEIERRRAARELAAALTAARARAADGVERRIVPVAQQHVRPDAIGEDGVRDLRLRVVPAAPAVRRRV